jgi:hypothetical protein
MAEEIKRLENISDEYLYSLSAKDGNVVLHFENSKLFFKSYLIFKNGYPNIDVSIVQEKFGENDMESSVLYQVTNSAWISEITIGKARSPLSTRPGRETSGRNSYLKSK